MSATQITMPTQATHAAPLLTPRYFSWGIAAVILVATFAFLWRLGNASLRDWDEATYAEISKEMVISGNWLTPQLDYQPWVDKPPLYMWATALLYSVFGIGEFWSRVISALSAIWLLILVYQIGGLLYGRGVGLIACLILLTSFLFTRFARSCMLDMTLSLFVYSAIYGFVRLQRGGPQWWYVVWGSFGLAVMVKSAAAFVIPLTIIPVVMFSREVRTSVRAKQFWWGLIIAIAIVTPWHLFLYAELHEAFTDQYFGYRLLVRSTTPLEGNSGDILFYVRILRDQFSPWFYLTPFTLSLGLWEFVRSRLKSQILLILALIVLGLYTAVQTKLPWYILPAYPSLAILTANFVVRAFHDVRSPEFSGLILGAGGFVLFNLTSVILIAAVICAMTYLGLRFLGQLSYRSTVVSIFVFLLVFGVSTILPLYLLSKSPVAQLSQLADRHVRMDREPLILYSGIDEPTARFYSNRPIIQAEQQSDLSSLLSQQQTRQIILDKKDLWLLSYSYDIHKLAESDPLVYATIKQSARP
jgi:4-amino-4-deoxy-L-arabinose transferase-like glycosyltransferase